VTIYDLSEVVRLTYPLVRVVELRNFSFDVKSTTIAQAGGRTYVDVVTTVKDRITGEPLELTFSNSYCDSRAMSAEAMLRDVLLRALVHEADECLYVNGERVRDPHRNPHGPLAELPPEEPLQHGEPRKLNIQLRVIP
jgi:hypothetical protein